MSEEQIETSGAVRRWIAAHRLGLFVSVLLVAVLLAAAVLNRVRTYNDYTVRAYTELQDSAGTHYAGFGGNLLKFSADGAFYTDLSGTLLWNDTYEMTNPSADQAGDYLILYDERGTQIRLLAPEGRVCAIQTSMPIAACRVSENGMVAVLMQDHDTGYIHIYRSDGSVYASGEVHLDNSGYPIAMAIGSGGQTLVLSLLDINAGDVKTTLLFYNFGRLGAEKDDHIVGRFSYANMVIPELETLDGEHVCAFGDNELVVFDVKGTPEAAAQIFSPDKIRMVFHCKSAFGFVTGGTEEDGTNVSHVKVYTAGGSLKYETDITEEFQELWMLSNGELAAVNEEELLLLSPNGERKFAYIFDSDVRCLLPQESAREYVIVRSQILEQIRLR